MRDQSKSPLNIKKIAIIGGITIIAICGVGYAVYKATNQVTEDLKMKGSQTKGHAVVKVDDVAKMATDGTINVPETSPTAQQAKEREEEARKLAQAKGQSHISQTRVENHDETEVNEKAENQVPISQEVNTLGQETNASKEETKRAAELRAAAKNDLSRMVELPLSESQEAEKNHQLADLKQQLARSQAGKIALEEKMMNQQAETELDKQRRIQELEALRAEKILAGAKTLFGGLAYAPPTQNRYNITYPDNVKDIYLSTSSTVFSPNDASVPAASGLYRSDGGETQPGIHPNYFKKVEALEKRAVSKAAELSKTETTLSDVQVDPERIVFDAGEIVYARTTLPIDSDIPGPIRLRILTGKAQGSIGFGEIELIQQASGAALTLESIVVNGKSIKAKAWALSPDTELSLFDDDVDSHYIQRFGGLFAGLFLSGFLDSLIETTTTTSNGETTSTTGAIDNSRDRIVYSVAKAAQGFLPILYDAASRPITVKIPKGQGMYLLFENQVLDTDTVDNSVKENVDKELINTQEAGARGTVARQQINATKGNSIDSSTNLPNSDGSQTLNLWN